MFVAQTKICRSLFRTVLGCSRHRVLMSQFAARDTDAQENSLKLGVCRAPASTNVQCNLLTPTGIQDRPSLTDVWRIDHVSLVYPLVMATLQTAPIPSSIVIELYFPSPPLRPYPCSSSCAFAAHPFTQSGNVTSAWTFIIGQL